MLRTSTSAFSAEAYLFTPTTTCAPLSIRACNRAALSSMRCLGSPCSMAFVMPPSASISLMVSRAAASISLVRASM